MGTQIVQIQFHNNRTQYKPGEQITGLAHLDMEKLSNMKEINGENKINFAFLLRKTGAMDCKVLTK